MKIEKGKPALVLAPMEGVTDAPMRALMTEKCGFSFCVSEFIRISHQVLPDKLYLKYVPELRNGGTTPTGTPVQVQLLGGNPERLAESAAQAVRLGALAIDMNFGCPAPTVNRHDGGATLLKYPKRIYEIIRTMRKALPTEIPLSAKLRLGWDSVDAIYENAAAVEEAGASWMTIHARTKMQGYAPPAHWDIVGRVSGLVSIPVVVNGEIWSIEDFRRCQGETGAEHYMVGRGALADPALSIQILRELGVDTKFASDFASSSFVAAAFIFSISSIDSYKEDKQRWLPMIERFSKLAEPYAVMSGYTTRRIKQWLGMANKKHSLSWFDAIKRAGDLREVFAVLRE